MSERINISSGAAWEDIVGYSRAVRIGNLIEVAGTTAVNGDAVTSDNVYGQTVYILGKIDKALKDCGASLKDVIRTRIYITDISLWEEAARAHGEAFRNIKPVTSMVEVSGLIREDLLVEVEATAYISQ